MVPAAPVPHEAAPALAVSLLNGDDFRDSISCLCPPEVHPLIVSAMILEVVPNLRAAEVFPLVASTPTLLIPALCAAPALVAPSQAQSERCYPLVPAPTVLEVHWKESS